MKERPIPFSAPMVRALLDGSKTQTRRVVKMPPSWDCIVYADFGNGWWPYRSDDGESPNYDNNEIPLNCPYGQPGDRLWVREAWRSYAAYDQQSGKFMQERLSLDASQMSRVVPVEYPADGGRRNWSASGANPGRVRHGRFMPRWASRILLEIVSVRVERLQDISDTDAIAEGIGLTERAAGVPMTEPAGEFMPRAMYRALWESINGAGSWDANPWVWVVEFKRVQP